jgi:hypothetical protein
MFDAVDGNRAIEDIVTATRVAHDAARVFFDRLWWQDQVVFATHTAA